MYAAAADLSPLWLSTVPDDAPRLIRAASTRVREATKFDLYATTPAGLPSDPAVAEAFRDAVCQQVAEWTLAKVDPDAGVAGQPLVVASQSVDGASVSYVTGDSQKQLAAAVGSLSPAARTILRNAGLGSRNPGHR
ncbi:hypothetical protein ACWEQ4_01240 [Rhodococcus sp. NPDC003994]